MMSSLVKFIKDELKHVYIRKLEQKKSELEYEIQRLSNISGMNEIFFTRLQDAQKSLCRIDHQLYSKKEAWKIE